MAMPAEIYRADIDAGSLHALTNVNRELDGPLRIKESRGRGVDRRARQKDPCFVVNRRTSTQTKNNPLVVLIHGGPQSAWNDNWGLSLESTSLC